MRQSSGSVAITGATGFVGRHILPRLLLEGYHVRALVRDPARLVVSDAKLQAVRGDLFDEKVLEELVEGAEAVIHLVGIIMEIPGKGQTFERVHTLGTKNLLAAAKRAGVKHWVHMSALGSRPDAVSRYHQTKWAAEEAVRASGLPFTIFRPSLIHGPDGEFMKMVKDFWCGLVPPFVPYFGKEQTAGRLQPVWVEDVARCFVEALKNRQTVGETYPLGGPEEFTWPGLYLTCKKHLPKARNKKVVGVPVFVAKLMARLPGAPFNLDQVIMSQEDNTCQIGKMREHFGFEPAVFEATFAGYAGEIP